MRDEYINNAGQDIISPDYKGSAKMTNEDIHNLNIKQYETALDLLNKALNILESDGAFVYDDLRSVIASVTEDLENEKTNGLQQLNDLGTDPEDFEDKSAYQKYYDQIDKANRGKQWESREDVPEQARELWDIIHNNDALKSMKRGTGDEL